MTGAKEYFLRMREDDFNNLSEEQRNSFTYVELREENEYLSNKDDDYYLKLYKEQKKSKENLQNYLFKKRNK